MAVDPTAVNLKLLLLPHLIRRLWITCSGLRRDHFWSFCGWLVNVQNVTYRLTKQNWAVSTRYLLSASWRREEVRRSSWRFGCWGSTVHLARKEKAEFRKNERKIGSKRQSVVKWRALYSMTGHSTSTGVTGVTFFYRVNNLGLWSSLIGLKPHTCRLCSQ